MRIARLSSPNSTDAAVSTSFLGATAPTSARSWFRRLSAIGVAATLGVAGLAPVTEAATTYTVPSLSAEVTGTSVTAAVTVQASTSTLAQRLKVCVRSSNQTNLDYAGLTDVTIATTGTTYRGSKTFTAGTYSYWGCIKVADRWYDVGAKKSFTVAPATTTTPPTTAPTTAPSTAPSTAPTTSVPTTSAPSGAAMPTTSTKPGWAYSYGQDFTTAAPLGQFTRTYGRHWAGYVGTRNDTSRNGSYQPDKVLSVGNGMLDMSLGYDATTGLYNVAAPFPQPPAGVNGGSAEYLGMRTTIRFKSSNPMPGYKVAWLLWPSSWQWNDGEIDFPEADLDGTIWGFSHQANTGTPHLNALWARTDATFFDGWHTATTEWVPGKSVEFFLDGVSVGKTTSHVPTKPMHWTLQTETALRSTPPAKTTKGNISIDWLTVESYKP